MAVTDEMNDLTSSHHRRLAAENASRDMLTMKTATATKHANNDSSHRSITESHSEEDEEYLANDPYLAELLNSNHSRRSNTSTFGGSYYAKSTAAAATTSTLTTLSAHDAARTWNDLSSVHSRAENAAAAAFDHYNDSASSSSFMDSAGSLASFGGSEDGDHSNHHGDDDDSESHDDDDDLSLQKQAFQKLFDSPRNDAKEMIGPSKGLPTLHGPAGRHMYRSSSVRVRPTYHGPKLGLIEENSLH